MVDSLAVAIALLSHQEYEAQQRASHERHRVKNDTTDLPTRKWCHSTAGRASLRGAVVSIS